MSRSKSIITQIFKGSASNVGEEYGQAYKREIAGFFTQEFGNYKYSQKYVAQCLKQTKKDAPTLYRFIEGMAKQSMLSLKEHLLLLLHEEELYHRNLEKKYPHCTAIGTVHGSGKNKGVLLGQTWDWSSAYFPWSSFNKFHINGKPKVSALSFPGLPTCAGINSEGLTVLWTGSGYLPPCMPKVGVPTYGIIFELLLKKDVPSAVKYLRGIKNAGAFIFFLADTKGNFVVIEAVPGKVFVYEEKEAIRANIYSCTESARLSRQKLPSKKKCHSLKRLKILSAELKKTKKRSIGMLKELISAKHINHTTYVKHATLWRLVADTARKEMQVSSWCDASRDWTVLK